MAPTTGFEFFPLTAGDPAVLVAETPGSGNIRLQHRLKPGSSGFQDAKLVGFFGYDQAGLPVVVKVARYPAADVEQLLDNERHGSAYSRWGRGQGFQWVSRPYVPGISLERAAREPDFRGTLPTLTKLLLRQIATVHKSGRYHGDIKPQNAIVVGSQDNQSTVLIEAPPPAEDGTAVLPPLPAGRPAADVDLSDPQVKLIDFEAGGTASRHGTRQATYRYASPEQLGQRPVGQPSDVFSWGLTTLAVFAPDAHPFLPAGTELSSHNIAAAMRVPAPRLNTDILQAVPDDALRAAVQRALTVDPAHRPTAEELLADLSLAPSEVADVATRLSDTVLLPAAGPGSDTRLLVDAPSAQGHLVVVEPHLPDDWQHLLRPAGPLGNAELTMTDRAIMVAVVTVASFLTALVVFVLVSGLIGRVS